MEQNINSNQVITKKYLNKSLNKRFSEFENIFEKKMYKKFV